MVELLAPAKNKECAFAAIDFGADAIYIGASEFGARKNVPNSVLDIKEIVDYAHKFNVKVYVTINTILTDAELDRASDLIKELEQIGVDAIIIQDMGLFEIVKNSRIAPHASTQCDNRTVEKVKFLQDVGFKRVVLARELSLEQIKQIKDHTQVELEAFIHGALCVSYSGQCYLSYAIGSSSGQAGRSANRGECAQPCRKKYSLVDEDGDYIAKDEHLLCLRDFNASRYIADLARVGVTSFKIEGRLKDVNYVKNVVGYYRKLIDNLGLDKPSSGEVFFDFEPDVEKSFNRGFTDYFLDRRHQCYSFDSPKSKGEFVGVVQSVGPDYFVLKQEKEAVLSAQDGLCFKNEHDKLIGCLVNKVVGNKVYPNRIEGVKVGQKLFRNVDVEFEKKLKNSKTARKISASITFNLNHITAIDVDGNSVSLEYEFEDYAKQEDKMRENILAQFKKSAESIFVVNDVNIESDKIPFLPVSKLNDLRRKVLAKLEKERLLNYNKSFNEKSPVKSNDSAIYPYKDLDYRANILNNSAKRFYENLGCRVIEFAPERGGKCDNQIVMTCKHCLKYAFNLCKSSKNLFLIDEKGKRYKLLFDCDKCEMSIVF